MPRVDELPMPARRQMQARDGGGDVHHGIERQKRKAGFLERLTGVGRSRDHDDRDYGAGDAHATEPRLAPVRRQAPLPRQPAPHEEPIARPAGPMPAAEAHPQAGDDDQLEIPAFLRRQAN
jgi:cell division protein FtsZ